MEQQNAFEGAAEYTAESIQRCLQLSQFIKRRLAIEEEYARALKRLCKSISLTPLQEQPSKEGWFWSRSRKSPATSSVSADLSRTSLWSTFYEIIDDTAQIAKSHTAFAESMQHQLLEPLNASIKDMEASRRQVVDQGRKFTKDLDEAASSLKKARKQFDQSNREMSETQTALEKAQNRTPTLDKREVEKMQARHRQAAERFTAARQSFRLQEEGLKNLQSKMYTHELPRIMTKLQQQEIQRSREALSYVLGSIELERRCAVMNENYANEMSLKLKQVNLALDEHRFSQLYLQVPIPLPLPTTVEISPSTAAAPERLNQILASMPLGEIPRTLSMPPAYESQSSAGGGYGMQRNATGGTAVLGTGLMSSNGASAVLMTPSCPALE